MPKTSRFLGLFLCAALVACSGTARRAGNPATNDAGSDAGLSDAGISDAGTPTSCNGPSDCASVPYRPVCDPTSKTCVECLSDANCPTGETCRHDMTCHGTKSCKTTDDCGPTETCSPDGTCDLTPGRCRTDHDCLDASNPRCETTTLECVRCLADADCGAGKYCTGNACEPCSATDAQHCGAASTPAGCAVCEGKTPVCQAGACVCTADATCGAGTYCLAGACVACSPTDANHCGTSATTAGCAVCSDGTPTCSNGACVCTKDADCGTGRYCANGACLACSATDANHCGTASSPGGCAVCSGTTPTCSDGSCICTKDVDCGSGQECDGGHCQPVDPEWTNWTPAPHPSFSSAGSSVLDNNTGLVWAGALSNNVESYDDAVGYCTALDADGHDDWRLPTRAELLSLVDYANYDPAIDTDAFRDRCSTDPNTGVSSNCFAGVEWTSTPLATSHTQPVADGGEGGGADPGAADAGSAPPASRWAVDFTDGSTRAYPVADRFMVRCVRR